mgnify:CR=1 FL=1
MMLNRNIYCMYRFIAMNGNDKKNYLVADFEQISSVSCPCGETKRAFLDPDNKTASFHIVEISENSRPHFHKKMTEIYHVLEGDGILELDNDRINLKPGVTVMIKPGCIHRAVGALKLINVPIPTFDPDDEWFPGTWSSA